MNLMILVEAIAQLSMFSMIGLYLVFSNTIIRVLGNMTNGAEIMVEINKLILNPIFYSLFIGSALASLYWLVIKTGLSSVAGGLFFIGTVGVTTIKNVPMNNQLRDAKDPEARQVIWLHYLKYWQFWNHIRTISALCAGFLLLI